jgi:hypothetical protein
MINVMAYTPCPVADHKLATEGLTVKRHYCRMGQDYDCRCNYCSSHSYAVACEAAKEWNAATAEHRAWVASITGALKCLALVGRTMALVASMPLAIGTFASNAATAYHDVPSKGARYRVVGKAGNAKHHQGKVGVCTWIGESDYSRRPVNWRGRYVDNSKPTVRVGLTVKGEAKSVFVPFGQVERILESQAETAAQIERAIVKITLAESGVRPRWTGTLPARKSKKNPPPMAYVVSGRDRGVSGTVFWIGADKRTGEADARIGICVNGEKLFFSAYDCRNTPVDTTPTSADERALIERVAADAVMDEQPELARELLAGIVSATPMSAEERALVWQVAADAEQEGRPALARELLAQVG